MMLYVKMGKSKPKLKPKKEREEYEAWLAKHRTTFTPKSVGFQPLSYSLETPVGRSNTKHIPSLNTGGVAPAAVRKVYTGTKMIGIGTLHKSNAVPVFSDEEAQDIARMRR
jgi:hypothetical protein